jgi:hypothetical protein
VSIWTGFFSHGTTTHNTDEQEQPQHQTMPTLALQASSVVAIILLLLFLLTPPHVTAAQWATMSLSQAHQMLVATSISNLALFTGGFSLGGNSSVVDIYNASSNNWTTTALSQAHKDLAATSISNLALFTGGNTS